MIKGPSNTMIVGPSGSGKTALTEALLTEGTVSLGPTRPSHYCYGGLWEPCLDAMKKRGVSFNAELHDVSNLQCWFGAVQDGVLVLDDLMEEAGSDQRVLDLFTKESHHRGITVLYLCQEHFPPGRVTKTISRNAHYIIAFKNPRDKKGLRALLLQAFPDRWQNILQFFDFMHSASVRVYNDRLAPCLGRSVSSVQ